MTNYNEESSQWILDNEMLIRQFSHDFGYGSSDDWFGYAVILIPYIIKKWHDKHPDKPVKNSYVATALKNRAKDRFNSTKRHNADYSFGRVRVEDSYKIATEMNPPAQLTQQIFVKQDGQSEIVESLDGEINNRLTLGIVSQVFIEDKLGEIEVIDIL